MLALALVSLLHAAPVGLGGGVWLPSKIAAQAANGTASELDLMTRVSFGETQVTVGFGMEDETLRWRYGELGLEVAANDAWRKIEWKELRRGVVKTDLKRAGEFEELTFVPKTVEQLTKLRADKSKAALLKDVAGKWTAPGHTLELGGTSRFDGKPAPVSGTRCNLHCEGKLGTTCAQVGERLYLPEDHKLIEVSIEGSCGAAEGPGVETVDGGLVFRRP